MSKKNIGPFDPAAGCADKRIPLVSVAQMCAANLDIRIPKNGARDSLTPESTVKLTKALKKPKDILKFAWVPADKIFVNYVRQRWPELKHIGKVRKKWNIHCVTPLQCRYDPVEDRYYAADGQQHMIAWILTYGITDIPCFFVESTDPAVETTMLLALNTDSKPMGKYFIHVQECLMGIKKAVDIENTVIKSGCCTAYASKKTPGAITHIAHLYEASETYTNNALAWALTTYRKYWANEKIAMPTILGMLKLRTILIMNNQWSDTLISEIMYECSSYDSGHKLHRHINHAFERQYPTNFKGMGVREKIASGMISIYEQSGRANLAKIEKPFEIKVPLLKNVVLMQDCEDDEELLVE